ncbi:MAG: LTA synthase family protein [Gammaproteobacteria bacterium]|nr:LTA synthase family protein [Gammaproteobacteria bacterium]MDH5630262.1 LTA synthase family protein [Gammaproteobacteria bacterium]
MVNSPSPLFCFKVFIRFFLVGLLTLSFSRLLLVLWQFDRVSATDGLWFIMFQGIRFDLISLSFVALIPLLITSIFSWHDNFSKRVSNFNRIYLSIGFGLLVFLEMSTPDFINQYGLRPNVWFVEYLKYPAEVLSMLFHGYFISFILGSLISFAAGYFFYRMNKSWQLEQSVATLNISIPRALLTSFAVFIFLAFSIRSSFGHRPVSPSTVTFSHDQLVNTLAMNSFYSASYAGLKLISESNESKPYQSMPVDKIKAVVRDMMAVNEIDFVSDKIFTLHKNKASVSHKKNLVIILEESLGAYYVESLGGVAVTPNLQALGKEGWWFEQMYATGTRSARGIEAIITDFLPTRSKSTIKRRKSQDHFFTIANLLKEQGYKTDFIYGGDSTFDNMKGFFLANGFDEVFDQYDFTSKQFETSWGVSDEDLFAKLDESLMQKKAEEPFFTFVFTTSNHDPYEYPDNTIEPYQGMARAPESAAKYADFALGKFFEKAKVSEYWKNTVFLVIADHAAKVRGHDLISMETFKIPAVIVGDGIESKNIKRVVSQIDIPPTLLSLIGVEAANPMIGYDLTREDVEKLPQRAIMQYADIQGYRENDHMIVFQPDSEPLQFNILDKKLQKAEKIDPVLLEHAVAFSNLPLYLYENELYHLHE